MYVRHIATLLLDTNKATTKDNLGAAVKLVEQVWDTVSRRESEQIAETSRSVSNGIHEMVRTLVEHEDVFEVYCQSRLLLPTEEGNTTITSDTGMDVTAQGNGGIERDRERIQRLFKGLFSQIQAEQSRAVSLKEEREQSSEERQLAVEEHAVRTFLSIPSAALMTLELWKRHEAGRMTKDQLLWALAHRKEIFDEMIRAERFSHEDQKEVMKAEGIYNLAARETALRSDKQLLFAYTEGVGTSEATAAEGFSAAALAVNSNPGNVAAVASKKRELPLEVIAGGRASVGALPWHEGGGSNAPGADFFPHTGNHKPTIWIDVGRPRTDGSHSYKISWDGPPNSEYPYRDGD